MSEQAEGKSATPREQHIGCFAWAEPHPGVVLLSALAMAVLALPKSPRTETTESDTSGEEVPLFICPADEQGRYTVLLGINEAVECLAGQYLRRAKPKELSFFGGCCEEEIANVLEHFVGTVRCDGRFAMNRPKFLVPVETRENSTLRGPDQVLWETPDELESFQPGLVRVPQTPVK